MKALSNIKCSCLQGGGRDGQGGEMIQREDAETWRGEWVREVTAAGREISVL